MMEGYGVEDKRAGIDGSIFHVTKRTMSELAGFTSSFFS